LSVLKVPRRCLYRIQNSFELLGLGHGTCPGKGNRIRFPLREVEETLEPEEYTDNCAQQNHEYAEVGNVHTKAGIVTLLGIELIATFFFTSERLKPVTFFMASETTL